MHGGYSMLHIFYFIQHEMYMLMTIIVVHQCYEFRKNFLVLFLKYHENEAGDNISNVIRQYLSRY
jgi:hypothetical protein